ncbi:DUF1145 domain-containing protein [Alcanivorax hongdengensis]|uniref:DUF1145 domain-containing protein n=1 Tax=Alcanivorax hongdengensis TaxID=519051 RepID=UPI00058FA945|nr:DUF1145 domain-containing protein [Alcanivorax hongdengensis]
MGLLRAVIVVFWLAVLLALFTDLPAPFDRLLVIAGTVVMVLHVLELFGFFMWRRGKGGVSSADALMVLIFGVIYLKPRMRQLRHG